MTAVRYQLIGYVFVSIVLWMVVAQLTRRRPAHPWARRMSEGGVGAVLRFAYYVGLPYAALVLGVVPARYLGLVGFDRLQTGAPPLRAFDAALNGWQLLARIRDAISLMLLSWLPDLGAISGLAATMLLLLSVTWLGYSFFRPGVAPVSGAGLSFLGRDTTPSALRAGYQAIHWSFYRSAVWMLTGDLYVGFIGGILLVSVEWMLDPGWMARVHTPAAEGPLLDATLLIATSVIFFFVPNLWLLMPIHWLLAIVSRRMLVLGQRQVAANQQ